MYALARIPRAIRSGESGTIEIDLSAVTWIGHLPLLALCLGIQEADVAAFDERKMLMPTKPSVRAFLDRWGFYEFVLHHGFTWDLSADKQYSEALKNSRVLPIHGFERTADAEALRDIFRKTGTDVRNLLTSGAFLTERQVNGLADLIVFELCENAIEHSETRRRAYIFGRVSRENDRARRVYETHSARWEAAFFQGIRDEGMTELVIGDAGIGIVNSLRDQAKIRNAGETDEKILKWAFEPFSTRKRESNLHTRGLWAVKNKVRELGGILYLRTGTPTGGLSVSWDFFNEPTRETPEVRPDDVEFSGTQVQILLPHRRVMRRSWYRVRAPQLSTGARAFTQEAIQIPARPMGSLSLKHVIETLEDRKVLFLDMAQMDDEAWDRAAIDEIGREIYDGQGLKNARVWLLNPSEKALEALRVSEFVQRLWSEQALLLPVVDIKEIGSVPKVQYVFSDPNVHNRKSKSRDRGDTVRSRELLVELISRAATAGDKIELEKLAADLPTHEEVWLTNSLQKNISLVELSDDDAVRAALDIEMLARLAVDGVLRQTLEAAIQKKNVEQEREQVLYKLPSTRYCSQYIDPRILSELNPAARAAIEKWVEEAIHRAKATYALSYSSFAADQLTRALRTEGIQDFAQLEHYRPDDVAEKIGRIPPGTSVVLLIPISGSGQTIVNTAQMLAARGNRLSVVCVIDTMTDAERTMLRESSLDVDLQYLVRRPIEKWLFEHIPDELRELPVAVIDPETLLPIVPIPVLAPVLSDGEFWQLVATSKGLGGAITYKGIAYTTLFWVRNLLRNPKILKYIVKDLQTCFSIGGTSLLPTIICLPRETSDAQVPELEKTLREHFPTAEVIPEEKLRAGNQSLEKEDEKRQSRRQSFEGDNVAIVVAAASSGGGIARLLTFFRTARRIHLSIFINRIPDGIASAFAPTGGKVTLTSFQRVFTGSPALRAGNAQTIALPALRDYRPSCVSNRLLLFLDALQKDIREEMRSAENPSELAMVSRPFPKPDKLRFEKGQSYVLHTPAGITDLGRLLSRCSEGDRGWLYAVLEEAAARAEVAPDRQLEVPTDWRNFYLEQMQKLYVLAPDGEDTTARSTILEALLLDRWIWHKRSELPKGHMEQPTARAKAFSRDLLMDLENFKDPRFGALAIRAIAKIDRPLLIGRIDQILKIARLDRQTELTLSLELAKILDDDVVPTLLLDRLSQIYADRERRPRRHKDEFDIALANLFEDLGLDATPQKTIEFLRWDHMVKVLENEPPDHDRTIRALIRSMRGLFGPEARFLYYREIENGLYAYADAWPRKRITDKGRTIPEANLNALKLLGEDEVFYSPRLREDRSSPRVKAFLNSLPEKEREQFLDWGIALFRIRAEGKTGFLRVWQPVSHESELNSEAVMALRDAIAEATDLIDRKRSAVSAVGEWQYEQMLNSLRRPEVRSLTETLAAFTDRVRLLLGGDVATLIEFDADHQTWSRHHVSGPFTVNAGPSFSPRTDKRKFLTAEVAEKRIHRLFRDAAAARADGFHQPPAAPWAQSWLAFPLLDGDRECTAVIHVWHHIPGWFDPDRIEELIPALTLLGGSLQTLHAAYSKTAIPHFDFTQTELDRLTRRLINLLMTAESLTFLGQQQNKFADLAGVVRQAQSDLAHLLELLDRPATEPAEGSLQEIVSSVIAEAKKRYTEREFQVDSDPHLPPIRILPAIMTRAVEELLRNAKRHTAPGETVHVSLNHDGGNPGAIRLEVRNRGYGVPQELKEEIFARSGLLLVKTAAERHGGSIEEIGVPGESAVFRMTFPVPSA